MQVFIGYDDYAVEGVDEEFIQFIFDMVLSYAAPALSNSDVGLIVTSDAQMQRLNQQYRHQDQPTNVLAFANGEIGSDFIDASNNDNYLGDIYISQSRLIVEARDLQIAVKDRFVQLFVHGVLHLLGLDHQTGRQTAIMENLEDKIVESVLSA